MSTTKLRMLAIGLALSCSPAIAWSPMLFFGIGSSSPPVDHAIFTSKDIENNDEEQDFTSRRAVLGAAAMNIGLIGAAPSVFAAADDGATVYKSGKAPIMPGGKAKDKSDLKGTRKDPDFLRSVADCRSKCQNTPGSDGYARTKEDCLSECQDICCKTYEQCTFDIVPRI